MQIMRPQEQDFSDGTMSGVTSAPPGKVIGSGFIFDDFSVAVRDFKMAVESPFAIAFLDVRVLPDRIIIEAVSKHEFAGR